MTMRAPPPSLHLLHSLHRLQVSFSHATPPRAFSNVYSRQKGPPRPSPKISRASRPSNNVLPRAHSVEDSLPPLSILQTGYKAGALQIEPSRALEVLRRYYKLSSSSSAAAGWERRFCEDEDITPQTLSLLALTLTRSAQPARRALGQHLLHTSSALGVPAATFFLVSSALRADKLSHASVAAPLAQLRVLAEAPTEDPEAMVLLGRVYSSQANDDAALSLYRRAVSVASSAAPVVAQVGVLPRDDVRADALVALGLLLKKRGDDAGAETAFRTAALECDDPDAYFQLASFQTPGSALKESYLLKAASSGVLEACVPLAEQLLMERSAKPAMSTEAGKKAAKEEEEGVKMAKEYLFLAATAGDADGMVALAGLLREEGDVAGAEGWVERAKVARSGGVAAAGTR